MNLHELDTAINDELIFGINEEEFKSLISRIGEINWSEFLTLQLINLNKPELLLTTKYLNFSEVADPTINCNKRVVNDCILVSRQFATNTFTKFKSDEVKIGFSYFLLAYLQDTEINYSKEDIAKIRENHKNIHEKLVQLVNECDPSTLDALNIVESLVPGSTEDLIN